jgi:hypothetical protein
MYAKNGTPPDAPTVAALACDIEQLAGHGLLGKVCRS